MSETKDGFHFYDVPQEFHVGVSVRGTQTFCVRANSREDAERIVGDMVDADDFTADLDDVDDASIDWALPCSTRFYLVSRPGTKVSATSKISDGDLPRDPGPDDDWILKRDGYSASWAARTEGGADNG